MGGDEALQLRDAVRDGQPETLKEGNPMRGLVLSRLHLSSILLVSLLVLSTHVL
jgi:hypothetical protein